MRSCQAERWEADADEWRAAVHYWYGEVHTKAGVESIVPPSRYPMSAVNKDPSKSRCASLTRWEPSLPHCCVRVRACEHVLCNVAVSLRLMPDPCDISVNLAFER